MNNGSLISTVKRLIREMSEHVVSFDYLVRELVTKGGASKEQAEQIAERLISWTGDEDEFTF